jgi:hypothetical protein
MLDRLILMIAYVKLKVCYQLVPELTLFYIGNGGGLNLTSGSWDEAVSSGSRALTAGGGCSVYVYVHT